MKACFKILLSFSTVLLSCTCCFSQNALSDSLERKMIVADDDTTKVLLLLKLSEQYVNTDDDRAIAVATKALELSSQLDYTLGKIESYRTLGDRHREENNFNLALEYLSKGLAVADATAEYAENKAALYNSLGHTYRAQGNHSDAVIYFYKSLPIFEASGNIAEVASCYNNLGIIYRHLQNYTQSLYYLFKNLELTKATDNKRRLANCYNNIGATYNDKGEYDNALIYHKKALAIRKTLHYKQDISASLLNLSTTYALSGDIEKGLEYTFECLKIDQELNQPQNIAQDYGQIGEMYGFLHNYDRSIEYSLKALEIAKRIGAKGELKQTYHNLSNAYFKKKDFKNAFAYHQLYKVMKDSLLTEKNVRQMAEMTVQYETEKKENEIALLNKDNDLKQSEVKRQNIIKYVFIFGVMALFIVATLLYRSIRFRQSVNRLLQDKNKEINLQKGKIETQKAILKDSTESLEKENILAQYEIFKNQINPHFLFNSLNAISSLIPTDPEKAVEFTNQFSKVYQYIIALKEKLVVKIEEELDLINSYLFLQKIRFGENLIVDIDITKDHLACSVPPFSIQLLVENAIKHNIISTEHPLNISIKSMDGFLTVKNNLQKRTEKIASTGIGLKNLTDRYNIVSKIAPKFWSNGSEYIAHIPIINE
jgi:tetratricopeptide (TPR) repeat protein